MKALLLLYLLLGPLAWVVYAAGMFLLRKKLALLERHAPPLPDPAPSATIVIPAKDEGASIAECLDSALQQDYPDFSVLALDDRSRDQTGAVMDAMAVENPRLNVVHNTEPPPPGWTGKCSVLHRHLPRARGKWILLIDSDVTLQPTVLARTVALAEARGYGMLSLLLRLQSHTFWESLIMPLCGGAVVGLYTVSLANNDKYSSNAFANGQYILIRRDVYDAIGGHEAVRDKLSEDVALARQVKAKGLRPRVAWGVDLAAVHMYAGLANLLRGWSRNFYGVGLGSPWRILVGMGFFVVCVLSVYPMLAWGIWALLRPSPRWIDFAWLGLAGTHWILMTATMWVHYRWSGNPGRYAVLLPLGAVMMLRIFTRSLRLCATGNVEWRGDRIQIKDPKSPTPPTPQAESRR